MSQSTFQKFLPSLMILLLAPLLPQLEQTERFLSLPQFLLQELQVFRQYRAWILGLFVLLWSLLASTHQSTA
jgi:hypothetical protein